MQKNFFDLQSILEMLEGVHVSPYDLRPEKDREEKSAELLLRDKCFLLQSLKDFKENAVFFHDYPISPPILSLDEAQDLVDAHEKKGEKLQIIEKKEGRAQNCPKCRWGTQGPAKKKSEESEGKGFTAAKSMLPASVRLPSETSPAPKKARSDSGTSREKENPNVESRLLDMIYSEVMVPEEKTGWEDIAGLSGVKNAIKEVIVWPMLRPDIFRGLRGPPKALLLFGPPGTGKTLIGKCIASQSKSTFFSISASSLTSKWVGEGEKLVRALFVAATAKAPSVVFIDEIDSLLMRRTDGEQECTRRIKTEFLVQMDGAKKCEDNVLVVGATNRPQEIDEAARRRFVKRLYVPLPDQEGRREMIRKIGKNEYTLTDAEVDELARILEGYSGSDVFNLCREAAMEPIREVEQLEALSVLRPIVLGDFLKATRQIRKSVSTSDLASYEAWNREYGSDKSLPPTLPDCAPPSSK